MGIYEGLCIPCLGGKPQHIVSTLVQGLRKRSLLVPLGTGSEFSRPTENLIWRLIAMSGRKQNRPYFHNALTRQSLGPGGLPFTQSMPEGSGRSPVPLDKVGSGVVGDPTIYWLTRPDKLWPGRAPRKRRTNMGDAPLRLNSRKEACEALIRQEANRMNFQAVVIRAPNHNTRTLATGRRVAADPHLTVFFGSDWDHMQIQGHIFCEEQDGIPIAKMKASDRQFLVGGRSNCSEEYWGMYGSCGYVGK